METKYIPHPCPDIPVIGVIEPIENSSTSTAISYVANFFIEQDDNVIMILILKMILYPHSGICIRCYKISF